MRARRKAHGLAQGAARVTAGGLGGALWTVLVRFGRHLGSWRSAVVMLKVGLERFVWF